VSSPMSFQRRLPERVYYVASPTDATVLVAMDVQIEDGYVKWFDTVKERMMKLGRVVEDTQRDFTFEREGGGVYSFTPLTIELYEQEIKHRVARPLMSYNSLEDILRSFEETRVQNW